MNPNTPFEVATGLLGELVAYFDAQGADLPERRIVSPGAPGLIAWDCPQIAVILGQIPWGIGPDGGQTTPTTGAAGVWNMRHLSWSVQIVRCIPGIDDADGQPTVPSPAALSASAELIYADMALLSQGLVDIAGRARQLPWWPNPAGQVQAGQVTALGPDGGYAGCEGLIAMTG